MRTDLHEAIRIKLIQFVYYNRSVESWDLAAPETATAILKLVEEYQNQPARNVRRLPLYKAPVKPVEAK